MKRATRERRPHLPTRVSAALLLLALPLVASPALGQYVGGERLRDGGRAVKDVAVTLYAPIYDHTTISTGGWSDSPNVQANRLGVFGSIVAPLGERYGWRASIGGGWSKFEQDPDDDQLVFDDKVGDFLFDGAFFGRDPRLGMVGIRYRYRGRTSDVTDADRRNLIGLFGAFYVGNFDFDADFAYVFGQADGVSTVIDGTPVSTFDRRTNGFALEADARWYLRDSLAAVAGLALEVQTYTFSDAGTTAGNFESTAVGPTLALQWLPPLGKRKWLALEGSFSYLRLKGSLASGSVPVDGDRNQFGAGAVVRVQLPRVASLKELIREY